MPTHSRAKSRIESGWRMPSRPSRVRTLLIDRAYGVAMTTLPGDLVGSARERYQRADQVGDPRHRRHRGGARSCLRCARRARGSRCPSAAGHRARTRLGEEQGVGGRGRGLRRGDRRSGGRRRLHPAAERAARASGRSPRSRPGRSSSARSPCAAPSRRRSGCWPPHATTARPVVGGVRLPVPRADGSRAGDDRRRRDRRRARDLVAVPFRAGRPTRHPAVRRSWPAGRSRTSAATRSGSRGCSSMPSRSDPARSPTPCGPTTAWTRRCGER